MSSLSHPNQLYLSRFLHETRHGDHVYCDRRAELSEAVWPVDLAASFLYLAASALCSFYGLDNTALENAADLLPSVDNRT